MTGQNHAHQGSGISQLLR